MTTPATETSTTKTTTIMATTTTTTQIMTTTTITTTTTMIMTTTTNATTARIPNFLVVAGVGVFDMPSIARGKQFQKKKFQLATSWSFMGNRIQILIRVDSVKTFTQIKSADPYFTQAKKSYIAMF